MTDYVAYFVIKVPTPRHMKFIQERGICCVSSSSEMDLNVALACSSHVIFIFSIMGSHSFDGYGIMQGCVGEVGQPGFNPSDYYSPLHVRPVLVQLIRKGAVHFSQVGHIRDNTGLGGKGVSTAKDGVRLGIAAGRTLCRSIDKRAFKDDPVHYKDFRVTPDIFPDSAGIQACAVRKPELGFLHMEYEQYLDWYNGRGPEDPGPTLRNIFS